jgi:thiol:disulfide interchange protein
MLLRLVVAGFFLAWLVAAIYGALPARKLVKWRAAEGAARAAAAEHKPILYDFSASWCEPCQRMDREVFASSDAAGLINSNFVPVRVTDDDRAEAAEAVREQYGVASLPTLLVVHDPKGEPRRLEGFPGKDRTVAFLKQALAPEPTAAKRDDPPAAK